MNAASTPYDPVLMWRAGRMSVSAAGLGRRAHDRGYLHPR